MALDIQTNNYQAPSTLQRRQEPPVTAPVESQEPQESQDSSNEASEASSSNTVSSGNAGMSSSQQDQGNVNNVVNSLTTQQTQEQTDAPKSVAVDYVGSQSKQSQVEINLSAATDSQNSTASTLESLRNVQKQNNAVDAYATYRENQQGGQALFA